MNRKLKMGFKNQKNQPTQEESSSDKKVNKAFIGNANKKIKRSDSANKLLSEMSKGESLIQKLEKSDNTKLFINDFKKSIDKIDEITLR